MPGLIAALVAIGAGDVDAAIPAREMGENGQPALKTVRTDDDAMSPMSSLPADALVPEKLRWSSGDDSFTAPEKAAINGAILAKHPSITILGDPTPRYGCHGFTFGAGEVWIPSDRVEEILIDQGWEVREAGTHEVGDIAIYRSGGVIRHSGVVSAVRDGEAARIRSKWGRAGLYEHDPGDVPDQYGAVEIRYRPVSLALWPRG